MELLTYIVLQSIKVPSQCDKAQCNGCEGVRVKSEMRSAAGMFSVFGLVTWKRG
jgi:ferredoxin